MQYPADIRLIRVMCSGRVDLSFVLRAFSKGIDGVFIGGCHLNECHYITDGNYHALGMVLLAKKLMQLMGLNPERLRLEGVSAGEGIRFAEIMHEFSKKIRELGPLGKGEGVNPKALKLKLTATSKLVPFIRLVERERLRIQGRSEEAYRAFFASQEVDRLFGELIADKLAVGEIIELIREKPLAAGEISEILGLAPAEVAKHLNFSARQGLIRFHEGRALAAAVGD